MLQPPWIIDMEIHITLNLLAYSYGCPLSIDTKTSTIHWCMMSLWHHKVSTPSKIEKLAFCMQNISKNWLLRKKSWKHAISMVFFAKYVRKWNCKQCFDCKSLQIFSKQPNFKITGLHQPPQPPNFESLPYPRGRLYVQNFFAKIKRKDELTDNQIKFTPLMCIFEHQGERLFGDCCNPTSLGELGLT